MSREADPDSRCVTCSHSGLRLVIVDLTFPCDTTQGESTAETEDGTAHTHVTGLVPDEENFGNLEGEKRRVQL